MNRQDAAADWPDTKAGRTDRVKEGDREERSKRTMAENNNSRAKTHSDEKEKSLAHSFRHTKKTDNTHKHMHDPSLFMATDMESDTNVHRLYFTTTTKYCKFLTTPICWDFTDQTAGFQLASHNYVPRLPLHPLPLLSLMLTLFPSSSPTPRARLQLRMEGAVESARKSER